MLIAMLLFFSLSVCGLAALQLFAEIKRQRLEARLNRAMRLVCTR